MRLTKNVETYRLHVENEDVKTDEAYRFLMAMARAKEASQKLAITRGSIATPDYMEERVLELVKGQSSIKEVKIIKG